MTSARTDAQRGHRFEVERLDRGLDDLETVDETHEMAENDQVSREQLPDETCQ